MSSITINSEVFTSFYPIYPMETTIKMGMIPVILTGGVIKWRDMGKVSDTYLSKLTFLLSDLEAGKLEEYLKGLYVMDMASGTDFYPMTPYIDSQYTNMDIASIITNPNKENGNSAINEYTIAYIPTGTTKASPHPNICPIEAINIGGVLVPYPRSAAKIQTNIRPNAYSLNGGVENLDRVEVDKNEVAAITLEVNTEQARKLIGVLVGSRGSNFGIVTNGRNYRPFGARYNLASYMCRLASETIKVTHRSYNNFTISFKVQKVL